MQVAYSTAARRELASSRTMMSIRARLRWHIEAHEELVACEYGLRWGARLVPSRSRCRLRRPVAAQVSQAARASERDGAGRRAPPLELLALIDPYDSIARSDFTLRIVQLKAAGT